MTATLRQLVYLSKATRPMSADELDVLVHNAERRNRALDLGGALLSSGGLFLQALEGNPEDVDQVFARIQKDQRHSDVQVLVDHPIAHRTFRKWSMTLLTDRSSTGWNQGHAEAVRGITEISGVLRPGSAAHVLVEYFRKHVAREPVVPSPSKPVR